MIQTYDGVIHKDERNAMKHLDIKYSDIISKLAHNINDFTFQPGYTVSLILICEYIDTHLDDFEKLRVIKEDMKLSKENDMKQQND